MKRMLILASLFLSGVTPPADLSADKLTGRLNLAGSWRFRLDPERVGQQSQWFARSLGDETIPLPGTTDQAEKGYALDPQAMTYEIPFEHSTFPGTPLSVRVDERGFLVRPFMYIGAAWYERTITVPQDWRQKHVQMHLERVMWTSQLWVDGHEVGRHDSLVTPHVYELGRLAPGEHRLTVLVDNSMVHNTGTIGHAYGPETQSRWNGIVGQMELTATDPQFIKDVQVYPAADRQTLRVRAIVANHTGEAASAKLSLIAQSAAESDEVGSLKANVDLRPGEQVVELTVPIEKPVQSWDEFHPIRYRLEADLTGREFHHVSRREFGFRHIERRGRHLYVNDRRVFLRGTLDCCVYPNTGHPPVTLREWLRVLGIIKRYGFNHVRYHSWCPPEAAFEAADRLGLYLAPETLFWVDGWTLNTFTRPKALGRDPDVTDYVRREIRRISDAYGNHPSFALFCIGNEFAAAATDWDAVNGLIVKAKQDDPRHLYNASTARKRVDADDYWVTHNMGRATRGVGPPHTNWDFTSAARATDLPVVAHETGQRPIFPDYDDLLPKFTGPLKPSNYIRLRSEMVQAGLIDRVKDFERASAWFQIVQYKAEHEAMLRTPDFAGYQLLMLNDFPGQSEALVGILDPFWDSKEVVGVEHVTPWNRQTVPLARFQKYEWSTAEPFVAQLEVAHYGPADIKAVAARCSLTTSDGHPITEVSLAPKDVPTGTVTRLGTIESPLDSLQQATAMILTLHVGDAMNSWKLWAYPQQQESEPGTADVVIVTQFDEQVEQALRDGRRVLLVRGQRSRHTGSPGFLSQYWSGGWWGNNYAHLGLVCDPNHPALAAFPNEGHSDWQWHELFNDGTTWDLTDLASDHRPIVQLVSDFHYNRNLAQVFETNVEAGKLLACGYDLNSNLSHRHAARQMRSSLLRYVRSDKFDPRQRMTIATARELFQPPFTQRLEPRIVAFDSQTDRYQADQAIDGDPGTFWHTPWETDVPPFPHHLTIALKRPVKIVGLRISARQDNNRGGRLKEYRIYLSDDGQRWGEPVAAGALADHARPQTIRFKDTTAQYMRVEAVSSHEGKAWASVAELEIVPAEPSQ